MPQLDLTGYSSNKKRKRSGGERVFRFKSFGEHGCPVEFDGPFLENVKALVEYGQVETVSSCGGRPCSWSFQLEISRHPPAYVVLFVVEESIDASVNRQCKHCVYVGWTDNFICNKRYHFVLPLKDASESISLNWNWMQMMNSSTTGSAITSSSNNSRGQGQGHCGHAMHGVFHSNGFGHLVCINGVEMGSKLTGSQIMDFWDRLCSGLRARKVSLNDVSQKNGMELRLLHALAYGEPWFGRWGYLFGRGTFGVTLPLYMKAIEAIKGMPLVLLTQSAPMSMDDDVPIILSRYQSLSNHSLVTIGDLFHFVLQYESKMPRENSIRHPFNSGLVSLEASSRWSLKRIEMATEVIVEALKRAQFKWVSRQEVRDAARAYIGDTGLLDFVLKSLGNHVVGNFLVRRCLNPVTKVLEYCLEDISKVPSTCQEYSGMTSNNLNVPSRCKITKGQLMKDLFYLYKSISKEAKLGQRMDVSIPNTIPQVATRMILDSRYLIKDYSTGRSLSNSKAQLGVVDKLRVFCTVTFRDTSEIIQGQNNKRPVPPYECITLQESATIDELKLKVQRTFRELYWGLRGLIVDSIINLENKGTDMVFGLVEAGCKLVLEGRIEVGLVMMNELHEGGLSDQTVDCCCGTRDDDGERMVCCDICEVWQHTRCARISDMEEVPHIFLCQRCEQEIILSSP